MKKMKKRKKKSAKIKVYDLEVRKKKVQEEFLKELEMDDFPEMDWHTHSDLLGHSDFWEQVFENNWARR
jgi:hypothetical protein